MSEDQTELPGTSPAEAANQDDRYLDFFMVESGIAEAHDTSLVDPVVWSRIINPIPRSDHPEQVESLKAVKELHKQNKAGDNRKFGPFTPRSLALTRIVRDASSEAGFERARRVKASVAESHYTKLQKRAELAESELKQLKAAAGTDGLNENLRLDQLRQSKGSLYLLGDRLMRREFFDNHYWPAKNTKLFKDRQAYWRGAMLAAAQFGSDELVQAIFNNEVQELENEMVYWGSVRQRIARTVGGKAISEALMLKARDRTGSLEDNAQNEPAGEDDEAEEPASYISRMPNHILRSQIVMYESVTKRIKNAVEQGMSPAAAEKKEFAGGRAIWDEDGEHIIGAIPPDEQPSAEQLVKHELEKQERRRRWRSRRR